MADDQIPDTGSGPANPAPAPDAPAVPAAPAPLSAGLSALAIPPTGSTLDATMAKVDPLVQQQNDAYQRARDLTNQPTVPPNAPHAKLLQMISSLATGLSAFGTAMGTYGKEGGAKEVAEIQGEQQRQKLEAQQSAMNQRNQQIQQQITLGDTAGKMAQTIFLMAQGPLDWQAKDLAVKQGQQALTKGALDIQSDAYQKMLGGQLSFSQYQAYNQKAGTAPPTGTAAGPGGIPSPAISTWQKPILDATSGAYKDDPGIKQAAADFDTAQKLATTDPDAAAQGMFIAGLKAANIQDALQKGTASRLAADNADKAASETIGAKVKAEQDQLAQTTYNNKVAKDAQGRPVEDFATWQARENKAAETAVTQGDPTQMGAMAADGLLTIPQIALARQLDKKAFQQLLDGADAEAKRLGQPEIVINGKPTGHYFNANAATQQYDFAKEFNNPNSKTQQSISSANTFINHAADLNDLVKDLQTTNVPLLNAPLNSLKGKFGDADITRLRAAVEPVVTEYNNALAAGFAVKADNAEAADAILNPSSSAAQVATAAQQMAHTVLRRVQSTDQQYLTHTGVHYPNMLTPDAQSSLGKLGLDSGGLQSGGSFAGAPQSVNAGTTGGTAPEGHQVNLAGGGTATKKGGKWINDQTGQEVKAK